MSLHAIHGKQPVTSACASAERRPTAVVQLLLEAGADRDKTDQGGLSPLHLAARRGYDAVVKVLLASSAHAMNAINTGCMSIAVKHDQTAIV